MAFEMGAGAGATKNKSANPGKKKREVNYVAKGKDIKVNGPLNSTKPEIIKPGQSNMGYSRRTDTGSSRTYKPSPASKPTQNTSSKGTLQGAFGTGAAKATGNTGKKSSTKIGGGGGTSKKKNKQSPLVTEVNRDRNGNITTKVRHRKNGETRDRIYNGFKGR